MIQPKAITIALVRDPNGDSWVAQIQMEYRNRPGTDAMNLHPATDPLLLIERARNAISSKINVKNGKIIKLK